MKLVLLSDTHGKHDEVSVPNGDVLVHAGDLTMLGHLKEYESVARWLNTQPHKYIVIIAGNHDFSSYQLPSLLDPRIHYLNNSGIEIENKFFWGSPITPRYGRWAHMLPRSGDEIRACWNKIPEYTNILITHGPPAGVLDKTIAGDNAGCKDLHEAVTTRIQPEVHVFGHIHEGAGIRDYRYLNNPCYVNASVVNEYYKVVHPPTIVEI